VIGGGGPAAAADVMLGRRGEMGFEEGELELEEGEAASAGGGGRELVVPDALAYIVRTFSDPFLFYFFLFRLIIVINCRSVAIVFCFLLRYAYCDI